MRVFSTWTQSPSRLVAVNCVPLGAVPRTGAFPEGADLMFTPGRCKKTRSGGVTALGATWGVPSAVREAATSGEGTTPDAPRDGSGTVGAGCTGVSDDDSTLVGEDASGVPDDDCTAIAEDSADSAGTFAPGEARKKYVSTATPNAAMIAVPAISFRRDRNGSYELLGAGGWKRSSPPITGRKVSSRRRRFSAAVVPFGARGGAQGSAGGFSLPSAKLFPLGRTLGRASVISMVAMLPPCSSHQRFSPLPHRSRIEGGPALQVCSPHT
jgi:hypothetical protein